MKVIARTTQDSLLVDMTIGELRNLAGFNHYSDFDKAFGSNTDSYEYNLESLQNIENIPVGDMYKEAKETLSAYQVLRTKHESIRNQISTLLKKMALARPQEAV